MKLSELKQIIRECLEEKRSYTPRQKELRKSSGPRGAPRYRPVDSDPLRGIWGISSYYKNPKAPKFIGKKESEIYKEKHSELKDALKRRKYGVDKRKHNKRFKGSGVGK